MFLKMHAIRQQLYYIQKKEILYFSSNYIKYIKYLFGLLHLKFKLSQKVRSMEVSKFKSPKKGFFGQRSEQINPNQK